MSVMLHSTAWVRSFFRGLGGSIQKVAGAVMLYFTQKLGADAQIHVFVGRGTRKVQAREINHLRAELKKGYWAAGEEYNGPLKVTSPLRNGRGARCRQWALLPSAPSSDRNRRQAPNVASTSHNRTFRESARFHLSE